MYIYIYIHIGTFMYIYKFIYLPLSSQLISSSLPPMNAGFPFPLPLEGTGEVGSSNWGRQIDLLINDYHVYIKKITISVSQNLIHKNADQPKA
jgi:hypothetical protein